MRRAVRRAYWPSGERKQRSEDIVSQQDPNVVNPKRRKRVAIVIANPAISATTGWPVGFWWSELTHPYYLLTQNGWSP
jgi:hypothetical protein